MLRTPVALVLGALLGLLLTLGIASRPAERAARAATDSLAVALRDASAKDSLAHLLESRALVAEDRANRLTHRADSLERTSVRARVEYVTVRATAPDTCAPVIAAADSALSAADSVAETLRGALQSSQEATNGLRAALDTTQAALARLKAPAAAVVASRPSLFARLRPRLGVGAAAGVDPLTGRPSTTTGITLGWTF